MNYFKETCFIQILFLIIGSFNFSVAQTTNPFALVNSAYEEQNPVITPDGKALYFTIANHPDNVGGKKDLGDIWVSINLDGKWQSPQNAGAILNDENYNGVAGFSEDGMRLYLLGHYSNGVVATQGISVSSKTDLGWSYPEKISIPYFLNKSSSPVSGSVSLDESTFVFSAESFSTTGAEDIYVTNKNNGRWSEPINLGKVINTTFQEKSPVLSKDLRTLYFASNGHRGLGGFDIFVSVRKDDSWTNWSTPENLGESINSEARELFYRTANTYTLFTSTRDSNGYGDIKTQADSRFIPKIDTLLKIQENKYAENNTLTVLVTGKVTDSKTKAGISAKLFFKSDTLLSVVADADGKFKIRIPSTKVYSIELEKKSYVNLLERLDIQTLKLTVLEMNFQLQPIEVGTLVNLKNVLFNMGTTSLLEESYPELDAVVDFLKSNPKVEIELEGHTDNRGDAKKNATLSKDRVERIKSYLVSKGITARRIKGKGFGGSKPITAGDTEEARKLNRRVEFLIIKN